MTAKILLIEDNPQNLYLVRFLLERHGMQVLQAENGQDGLDIALREAPDLILLDIQLPGIDGYAVARALKADRRSQGIPVVAVTSHAMAGDRERCLEAGAEGYVEKPIDPDTFVAEIARFLPARAKDNPT